MCCQGTPEQEALTVFKDPGKEALGKEPGVENTKSHGKELSTKPRQNKISLDSLFPGPSNKEVSTDTLEEIPKDPQNEGSWSRNADMLKTTASQKS